jgi:hypothetical protein
MASVIEELAGDADQRFRLGRAARRTFEWSFTRQALLPRYEEVLAHLRTRSTPAPLRGSPRPPEARAARTTRVGDSAASHSDVSARAGKAAGFPEPQNLER